MTMARKKYYHPAYHSYQSKHLGVPGTKINPNPCLALYDVLGGFVVKKCKDCEYKDTCKNPREKLSN